MLGAPKKVRNFRNSTKETLGRDLLQAEGGTAPRGCLRRRGEKQRVHEQTEQCGVLRKVHAVMEGKVPTSDAKWVTFPALQERFGLRLISRL